MKKIMFLTSATVLSLASLTGCNSFPKMGPVKMPFLSKEDVADPSVPDLPFKGMEYEVPTSLGVIWTDSSVSLPGKPTTRGFGGRFFFYDERGDAVAVDGELTIYGFDDTDDENQRNMADKKFVFRRTELQGHAGQNEMGVSYNFWVPWDAVGGDRMTVSLLPIFQSADGKMIRGEMAVNVLPGKTPVVEQDGNPSTVKTAYLDQLSGQNRLVDFSEGVESGQAGSGMLPSNRTSMKTTTISVPQGLGNRMKSPQISPYQRQSRLSENGVRVATQRSEQGGLTGQPVESSEDSPSEIKRISRRPERPRPTINTGAGPRF